MDNRTVDFYSLQEEVESCNRWRGGGEEGLGRSSSWRPWTIKLQVMRYCRNSYQEVGVEIGGGEVEGEVGGEVREV